LDFGPEVTMYCPGIRDFEFPYKVWLMVAVVAVLMLKKCNPQLISSACLQYTPTRHTFTQAEVPLVHENHEHLLLKQ
jgi:hypothetical protein